MSFPNPEETLLSLAPTGRDNALIVAALNEVGIAAQPVPNIYELTERLRVEKRGAILIAEEALHPGGVNNFMTTLASQEKWSDIPVILMTGRAESSRASQQMLNIFTASGNVTLLERPCRAVTIISSVQVALRARRKQYQVRDLLKELEFAVSQRDEFMSIASHELKTPVTSMKLQMQLGERSMARGDGRFEDPENLKRMLRSTNKQLDRLTRLIEDMLDVSRVNTGTLSLRVETVNLAELVQEMIERFSAQLIEAGCSLTTNFDPNSEALVDRYRIEQVISNLITNSIKYSAGKPVSITVRADPVKVVLIVRDEGSGIAPSDQARIFQRFERAVRASNISGLGLGLYITRQIIETHGGGISVQSEIGKGSTFTVELPREQPALTR